MLFNSWPFVAFFCIVYLVYRALPHRQQNWFLLLASLFFYGCWDWRFLGLLLFSTGVDYWVARLIEDTADPRQRRRLLSVSMCVDLGILGFFKYCNFFTASFARLLEAIGFQASIPVLQIVLPVGISFYTFQSMSYTIDVYRGLLSPTHKWSDYVLYVSFFPQLVAGPIERSTHLLPQIQNPRNITPDAIASGLRLIVLGYFRKVFIADAVAPMVGACFAAPSNYGGGTLLLGVYLFALQIYGDFAGYSDIARGTSRLFGIDLCLNFRQPYLSSNITEFWRRWHISLSTWLRDYLYIPLGGNRKGRLRTYINNMLTMLLGGLWHGAAWHFVAWGGLHGAYLMVHKMMIGNRKIAPDSPATNFTTFVIWLFKCFVTFNLVCLAWIFFRADCLTSALKYLYCMFQHGGEWVADIYGVYFLFYGSLACIVDYSCFHFASEVPTTDRMRPIFRGAAYAVMLFLIITIGEYDTQPFIYFQF